MSVSIGPGWSIGPGVLLGGAAPPGNSYLFTGTGAGTSYLAMSPGIAVGTSNFTVEFWFRGTNTAQQLGLYGDGATGALQIYLDNGGAGPATGFQVNYQGAGQISFTSPVSIVSNTWYYFALVRQSNSENIFVNTSPSTPTTDSNNYSGATTSFGNNYKGSWQGNIYNLRVSNIARYSPSAGSITVPTSPLTADANTLVLFNGSFLTGTAPGTPSQTITQGGSGTAVALSSSAPL